MLKNVGLKFSALLLAIIFWAGVVSLKNNIKPFQEPVTIKPFNIAENLTLANSLGTVELKLEASQETYVDLSVNDFEAYIDLKGLNSGEHNVPIQVTSKNPKVKVVKIEPNNTTINIEEITSKTLNVSVEIKGNAAENFEAQDPLYELTEVEVQGPKNLIERATEVKAEVTLKGLEMTDIRSEISLFAYDENQNQIRNLQIVPPSVAVTIPVIQIQKYKTVGVRANLVGDLESANYFINKVLVSPSTVVIQGNTRDLKKIDYIETKPIDITSLDHNTLKRMELILPAGINTQETSSVLVTIEVDKIDD